MLKTTLLGRKMIATREDIRNIISRRLPLFMARNIGRHRGQAHLPWPPKYFYDILPRNPRDVIELIWPGGPTEQAPARRA